MERIHTNDYEGRNFLTVSEVCSLLGFSHSTLKRREKSGEIPAYFNLFLNEIKTI